MGCDSSRPAAVYSSCRTGFTVENQTNETYKEVNTAVTRFSSTGQRPMKPPAPQIIPLSTPSYTPQPITSQGVIPPQLQSNQSLKSLKKDTSQTTFDKLSLEALQQHNHYRTIHHAQPLTLNNELCAMASELANSIAETDSMETQRVFYKNEMLGQNLVFVNNPNISGVKVSDIWYNEINLFNWNAFEAIPETEHFSQMVWKGTRECGFGFAKAKNGGYFGVGLYYPKGNVLGQFNKNVAKKF